MSEDEAVLNKQEYEEINKRQGKRLLTLELRLMQEREAHANTRQIREVLERELYQLQEAVEAEQTAHAETRRRLEEIERCIPETFYAGIPLPKRVEFLRQQWRRLHEVNQDLERRLADSESIRSAEKEILIKEIADHAETRRRACICRLDHQSPTTRVLYLLGNGDISVGKACEYLTNYIQTGQEGALIEESVDDLPDDVSLRELQRRLTDATNAAAKSGT
jgi:hypothetical protein